MSPRVFAALALIWLAACGMGNAQGLSSPAQSSGTPSSGDVPVQWNQPYGPQAGQAPTDDPGSFGGPVIAGRRPEPPTASPGFGAARAQPGFAGQPEQGQQPVRQNYADELAEFGVAPQAEMQPNVGSPTPTTIPGGHVITTAEMQQAAMAGMLIVDVLEGAPHPGIPGSVPMPGAGRAGTFTDDTQQKLWAALSRATQMQPNRPIAFLCAGSRCWEL